MLPITGCAALIIINLFGPVHAVVTVTGAFTAGVISTVQIRVTSDPTGRMGLTGSLVTIVTKGTERTCSIVYKKMSIVTVNE